MNKNTILFVDDEEHVLNSLKRLFRNEGYQIFTAKSVREGAAMIKLKQPSIVVSDQRMPEITGNHLLKAVKKWNPDCIRILLTGFADMKDIIKAINQGGIYQYVSKPWNDEEIKLTIRQAVEYVNVKIENKKLVELTKQQIEKLKSCNQGLAEKIISKNQELTSINSDNKGLKKEIFLKNNELTRMNREVENNLHSIVEILISILKTYSPALHDHVKRVASLSLSIARKMKLEEESLINIEMASLLHDIGMVGMPHSILNTPFAKLTQKDKELFEQHPVMGEKILSHIERFKTVGSIIRSHHEYFNGKGFPDHLTAYDISLESRIIAIADAFDEVQTLEPFKTTIHMDINSFLTNNSGKRFEPTVVKIFLNIIKELKQKKNAEKKIPVSALREGMIISQDMVTSNRAFHVGKNTLLKKMHIDRIKKYEEKGFLKGKISVFEKRSELT